MKVKINKYIFSLFRPPFFGKTKRRLPGNSLPMSHNIFYSLPMRFLICDDVRLAHRRGESPHLRRRNMQAGCGGVTLGVERKVACPEQIVHRGPGLGRVPRDGLENIAGPRRHAGYATAGGHPPPLADAPIEPFRAGTSAWSGRSAFPDCSGSPEWADCRQGKEAARRTHRSEYNRAGR